MLLKSCLLPIASVDQARRTLPHAAHLAGTLQADLTLLRVINPFQGGPRPVSEELEDLHVGTPKQRNFRLHVTTHSDPASSVASYARTANMDAILLPSARSSWQQLFSRAGSLLRRLVQRSPCPLWLMRETPGQTPIRRVLCAVTGRDTAALQAAASLSRRLGARLYVLHVIPEIHEGVLAYGFDDHLALSTDHAVQMLERMQERVGSDGQIIVQTGGVQRNIRKAAARLHIDLVVTGRTCSPHWPSLNLSGWSSRSAPQLLIV